MDLYRSPIKWVGGKNKLLKHIIPKIINLMKFSNIYVEPFVGGGSVIIELLKQCLINQIYNIKFYCFDSNPILISMFNEIKHNPNHLIEKLKQFEFMKNEKDYYRIRQEYNQNPSVEMFMYLNKTGFRGLYSVNQKNEFNVSYGFYKDPVIYDEENILALSNLFNIFDVNFLVSDYTNMLSWFPQCIMYLDPPYFDTFGKYSKNKFCYQTYINFLKCLKQNDRILLIHSNSFQFTDVYFSNEIVEKVMLYDRINSKNPGKIRIELIFSDKRCI